MTVTEIAVEHGVSRQTIHTYRRTGIFPSPVEGEGSTRLRFREDEVIAFFKANPKQPRKKRRFPPAQQGEAVATTTDPRIAILSALNEPPYNEVAEARCVPWAEAEKLLDAYRAAIVAEVVEALQAKAGELSAQADQEMRQDLEDKAQVWHEAAEVTRRLKRAKQVDPS
jgi:predicted DNA-binding transcriptional regulator AlpA